MQQVQYANTWQMLKTIVEKREVEMTENENKKANYQVTFSFHDQMWANLPVEELLISLRELVTPSSPITVTKVVDNIATNEILFQDVEFLMGGECECGNNALECTDNRCPTDATDYCQKDTLTRLRKALGLA